jgi:tetratricopeptide (TPR) repeat protein
VISTLLEPFGVLYSRERQRELTRRDEGSRLACIDRTYEFLRNRDPARHADARTCLAQSTSVDPTFTTGLSLLALVQVVEYQMNIPAAPGEAPPLDRALKAGSEAIRSKPNSARAHAIMADVLMTRGQVAEAKATGDKALALNPYDRTINFYVGTMLIFSGDMARGREVLRDFIANSPLPAPRARFAMFVADYTAGDLDAARRIDLSTDTDQIARAWMARGLLAWKAGDQTRTHEMLSRLYAIGPSWKSDARGELGRFFGSRALADRFAADLAAAASFATM